MDKKHVCRVYHNQPVLCQSQPRCAYRKSGIKKFKGQCYKIHPKYDANKIKMRSRHRIGLRYQFEKDSAHRLLRAYKKKKRVIVSRLDGVSKKFPLTSSVLELKKLIKTIWKYPIDTQEIWGDDLDNPLPNESSLYPNQNLALTTVDLTQLDDKDNYSDYFPY